MLLQITFLFEIGFLWQFLTVALAVFFGAHGIIGWKTVFLLDYGRTKYTMHIFATAAVRLLHALRRFLLKNFIEIIGRM